MSLTMKTTKGDLKFELHLGIAPRACRNFLVNCASYKYHGVSFHRLISSFLVQAGLPTSDKDEAQNVREYGDTDGVNEGEVDAGRKWIKKEISASEMLFSSKGLLAMVSAADIIQQTSTEDNSPINGQQNKSSSANNSEVDLTIYNDRHQFFITLAPAPHLNGKNTVFGHLIAGWDTLQAIESSPVQGERPLSDIVIKDVIIHANPLAQAT